MSTPHTAPPRADINRPVNDGGSITPLVIGMVLCLLLLGAGVTAATSGFLARQNLQHSCDGAADAAADAARSATVTGDAAGRAQQASTAALAQLHPRLPHATVVVGTGTDPAGAVDVACTAEARITMGSLFGVGHMTFTVHSVGRSVL